MYVVMIHPRSLLPVENNSDGARVTRLLSTVIVPFPRPLKIGIEPLNIGTEPLHIGVEPLNIGIEPLSIGIEPF